MIIFTSFHQISVLDCKSYIKKAGQDNKESTLASNIKSDENNTHMVGFCSEKEPESLKPFWELGHVYLT
jgi:hypothetical protein